MTSSTDGERWFWRLVAVAALVGGVWYYSWLWLPHAILELPFASLLIVIAAIVFFVRRRDRNRGFSSRAARIERETWLSTLPPPSGQAPRPDHDPPSNVRC